MSAILQELGEQEAADNEAAIAAYHGIVAMLASGEADPELAAVQDAIAGVNKNTNDLRGDVANARHRDILRARVAAAQAAVAERSDIKSTIEEANRVLEAARAHYRAVVRPLDHRLREIEQLNFDAFQARRELQESCNNEQILTDLSLVRSRLDAVGRKVKCQEQVVSRIQSTLANEKTTRRPARPAEWRKEDERFGGNPQRVATLQARLEAAAQELSDLRTRQAGLCADESQLLSEMIDA